MHGFPLAAMIRGGVVGVPVGREKSQTEEKWLVRWLNDEWGEEENERISQMPREEFLETGAFDHFRMPTDEDESVRRMITSKFIPWLSNVQNIPFPWKAGMKRARLAMKLWPELFEDEEQAFNEVNGINDRARILNLLKRHTIVPFIEPYRKGQSPVVYLAAGPNMTEVWATHTLLQMARDGSFLKLAQCECGCGKWFIRRRSVDRFRTDYCRVRFHQSDPEFKEKRRVQARNVYRIHNRDGLRKETKLNGKKTRKR